MGERLFYSPAQRLQETSRKSVRYGALGFAPHHCDGYVRPERRDPLDGDAEVSPLDLLGRVDNGFTSRPA